MQQAAQKHNVPPPKISTSALSVLENYQYPGNVRELKNAIEHAVIMCGDEIEPKDLPDRFIVHANSISGSGDSVPHQNLQELREQWLAPLERRYLSNLLNYCEGNVRKAAKIAGINHVTLYRLLKKRGLSVGRQIRDIEPS